MPILTMDMKTSKIIGLIILAVIWIWLSFLMFTRGGGFNLKNIFIMIASGIIIFVPLLKNRNKNSD